LKWNVTSAASVFGQYRLSPGQDWNLGFKVFNVQWSFIAIGNNSFMLCYTLKSVQECEYNMVMLHNYQVE